MKLEISDLAFAGFRYKDLLKVDHTLGVEFFYEFGTDIYWDAVLPQIMKNRPQMLSIHGPCLCVNLADAARDKYYEKVFQDTFTYAKKVQAEFVVVHTNEEVYDNDLVALRYSVLTKLRYLEKMARAAGVTMVVENVGLRPCKNLLFDWQDFQKLMADLPEVPVLIDTGHAHVNGWNLPEVFKYFGNRIIGIHVHDNNGLADQHQAVGQGNIDWQETFAAIKTNCPKALLVLEYASTSSKELAVHVPMLKEKYGL